MIGHEIGHAFDSSGIYFDKDGAYNPGLIPDEDRKILKERDQKAVSYFEDNFTVFGVYHVDGDDEGCHVVYHAESVCIFA